jgi:DNA-directed RNA polymerase specialized sigma24 family protein
MAQYIKNKELLQEVIECKERGEMSNKLANAFIQMATRYSTKPNFVHYTYREDMVSDALVTLCRVWDRFDHTKSANPFAFYTQVIHNQFIQILNKEKKQRNIRDAVLTENGQAASWTYQDEQAKNDLSTALHRNENKNESEGGTGR